MRRIITFCVMVFCIAITPTETKAQNPQKGDSGYLYCHMSGRGEWTAYAISRDGLNYQDIIITHTPTRRSLTSQSHVSSLIGDMPLSMPTSIICLPTDSIT